MKTSEIGYKSLTCKALAALWVIFAVCVRLSVIGFIGECCVARKFNGEAEKLKYKIKEDAFARTLPLSFDVVDYNDAFLRRFHEFLRDCEYTIVLKAWKVFLKWIRPMTAGLLVFS